MGKDEPQKSERIDDEAAEELIEDLETPAQAQSEVAGGLDPHGPTCGIAGVSAGCGGTYPVAG